MYCTNCGASLLEEVNFCSKCGKKVIRKPDAVFIEDPLKLLDDIEKKYGHLPVSKLTADTAQKKNYKGGILSMLIIILLLAGIYWLSKEFPPAGSTSSSSSTIKPNSRFSDSQNEDLVLKKYRKENESIKKEGNLKSREDIIAAGGDLFKGVTSFEFEPRIRRTLINKGIDVEQYEKEINDDIRKGGEIKNNRIIHTYKYMDKMQGGTYYSEILESMMPMTEREIYDSFGH